MDDADSVLNKTLTLIANKQEHHFGKFIDITLSYSGVKMHKLDEELIPYCYLLVVLVLLLIGVIVLKRPKAPSFRSVAFC